MNFKHVYLFLELFIGKFIPNINNEHAQDYSCPGATFAFCSHGEKLPRQGGLLGVVQRVTRLSKLPRGNEKLMWTVIGVRPSTEAKLTPGSVSCPGAMSCPGIMWTGPRMFSQETLTDVHWYLDCLRACSHESGTVNYPGVMIAPGQTLPRVHMMICCPWATLPRVKFIAPRQVHRHLITTNLFEFL